MASSETTRCGSVSLIGLPNAGKSTLVNALVGSKVSITSRKAQTTRTRVVGIALHDQAQIILLDTPGIFQPKKTLDKAMVGAALDAVTEGDIVLHLVDVSARNPLAREEEILRHLPNNRPVYLVMNKVDSVKKDSLLALSAKLHERFDYARSFMISALKESGLNDLLRALGEAVPEGPWHYDEDEITTTPMRLLAAEITREAIFDQLHQEVPYAVLIEAEQWEEFDDGSVKINQLIYVQRETQKAMILGKGGARIKQIGKAAREQLSDMMGRPVHLKLFVKVQPNWPERAESYQIMGFDH